MERERIQNELKYYRSYKAAIDSTSMVITDLAADRWSKYGSAAPCRVAVWSDTHSGTGGGSKAPVLSGGMSFEDVVEYERYKEIVYMLELAMDTLTVMEREVLTLKWMDDLTLNQISERKGFSPRTAKTIHGRALDKMYKCLRFYYIPKVETPVA